MEEERRGRMEGEEEATDGGRPWWCLSQALEGTVIANAGEGQDWDND